MGSLLKDLAHANDKDKKKNILKFQIRELNNEIEVLDNEKAELLKDIEEKKNKTINKMNKPCKLTSGILKVQNAVRRNFTKKKFSLLDAVKQLILKEQQHAKKLKQKNRLQKLIKKHFFIGQKNQLDLVYISKVIAMKEQLEVMFRELSLGQAYSELGYNMWTNQFLKTKNIELKKEQPRFKMDPQAVLQNLDSLFKD